MPRYMSRHLKVIALIALLAAGCGRNSGPLTEVRRTLAGNIDVVLLSAQSTVKPGKDSLIVEFRRSGALVDVGTVKANATMPMPGMAPMIGGFELRRGDAAGRYQIESNLSMAGTWLVTLTWDGPSAHGSASLSLQVR